MAQQREAVTNHLVDLIAAIKIERKSGQLRVKRGEGLTSEEGILIFIQGQITQANVGRRHGSEALNWLSTWRQTRYIFISPGSEEEPFLSLSSPLQGTMLSRTGLPPKQVHTDRLETEPLTGQHHEIPRSCVEFHEATTRIERSGLPRSHRRLYLLIDGHRSIDDLEPLIGKKMVEVRSMLHDLEWLGVIRIAESLS